MTEPETQTRYLVSRSLLMRWGDFRTDALLDECLADEGLRPHTCTSALTDAQPAARSYPAEFAPSLDVGPLDVEDEPAGDAGEVGR